MEALVLFFWASIILLVGLHDALDGESKATWVAVAVASIEVLAALYVEPLFAILGGTILFIIFMGATLKRWAAELKSLQ